MNQSSTLSCTTFEVRLTVLFVWHYQLLVATGAIESPFYAWKSINFLLYYFVGNDFYLTFVKVIRLTRLLEWITRLYTACIGLQEARKRKVRRESLYYLLYYFRGIIPLPLTLCFHPLAFFLSNSTDGPFMV